jgi:hypothetical protein
VKAIETLSWQQEYVSISQVDVSRQNVSLKKKRRLAVGTGGVGNKFRPYPQMISEQLRTTGSF